jgi:hypothetical protein
LVLGLQILLPHHLIQRQVMVQFCDKIQTDLVILSFIKCLDKFNSMVDVMSSMEMYMTAQPADQYTKTTKYIAA